MYDTNVVERLGSHSTSRGYHNTWYAITAETYEDAKNIALTLPLNAPGGRFVSPTRMADGRWHCTIDEDTGD